MIRATRLRELRVSNFGAYRLPFQASKLGLEGARFREALSDQGSSEEARRSLRERLPGRIRRRDQESRAFGELIYLIL